MFGGFNYFLYFCRQIKKQGKESAYGKVYQSVHGY